MLIGIGLIFLRLLLFRLRNDGCAALCIVIAVVRFYRNHGSSGIVHRCVLLRSDYRSVVLRCHVESVVYECSVVEQLVYFLRCRLGVLGSYGGYFRRLGEQMQGADLEWREVFVVELVVVVITVFRAEQRQVCRTYYNGTAVRCLSYDALLIVELSCVLQGLVVVSESGYSHPVQSLCRFYHDVEVTHHIAREVIFCQFVQQFVLVHRVRIVCEYE